MTHLNTVLLGGFSFLAGFIDAIAGGGGLVQFPALLIFAPQLSIATAFGTNKVASCMGTMVALGQYLKTVPLSWGIVLPMAIAAWLFSYLGAKTVDLLNPSLIRPVILVLLIVVVIYTLLNPGIGAVKIMKLNQQWTKWISLAIGMVIGFYDGFFGPGTGSFLTMALIGILGFDFLLATASTKVVNTMTNLGAIIYFGFTNNIQYELAIPMGICNIAGAWLGSRLAIAKGNQFVRILFIVVVTALIAKFAYDLFNSR